MKRYRFTLATVLEVKKRREEVLIREKGVLELQKSRIESELKHWRFELAGLFEQVKETRARGRITVMDEEICLAREVDFKMRIETQRRNLLEKDAQIEDARLRLVEASKEKRILERLEERQWKEYLVAMNREEQGFLDELAQHQYFHQTLQAV